MKKSIKFMALAMAVMPCALVLTACGEKAEKDIVSITGDYQVVETNSYQDAIDEIDAGFDLESMTEGVRAVLTINANANIANMGKVNLSLKQDSVAKMTAVEGEVSTDDIQMSSKSTMKATIKAGKETAELKAGQNQYILNGRQYVDASGMEDIYAMMGETAMPSKYYQPLVTDEYGQQSNEDFTLPQVKVSDLLAMIPEGSIEEGALALSKSVEENGFKYKVEINAEILTGVLDQVLEGYGVTVTFTKDVVFYAIFANDTFSGAYLDAEATVVVDIPQDSDFNMFGESVAINVAINAQIASYAGEISFPKNLNSYPTPSAY